MIKIDKQRLIEIKNTRLSDKNGVTNMSYICQQKFYKKCNSIIYLFFGYKFKIFFDCILCFKIIVLSEDNTCIAQPNLEVLPFEFLNK